MSISVIKKELSEFINSYYRPTRKEPYQAIPFYPSDTEDRWKINLDSYSDSPHIQNYLNNPVEYVTNQEGMRTLSKFDLSGEGNVFLGCSHTFGIGHHLENVWSYKLSKKIGGRFFNISEPGAGIITQFRYLNYFKDKIKFKNVFHFYPKECLNRFEFYLPEYDEYQKKSITKFSLFNTEDKSQQNFKDFFFDILQTPEQQKFTYLTYLNAIENICKDVGANYYLLDKSWFLNEKDIDPYHKTKTPARDLMHYYVEDHDEIYRAFLEMYEWGNKEKII